MQNESTTPFMDSYNEWKDKNPAYYREIVNSTVHQPKPVGPPNVVFGSMATTIPKSKAKIEKDPSGKDLNSPGAKADLGKLRPWLVLGAFSRALEEVTRIGTFGAKKYTDNGWLQVDDAENRYMEAAIRHLLEYGKGNMIDDGPGGTNCKHLGQVAWNILAVLELQARNERN